MFRLGKALARYVRSGGEVGAAPNYHHAYEMSRMLATMSIHVDPKTIAETWDPYWMSSVYVEYDIDNDPAVKAAQDKRRRKAEEAQEREKQRAESRRKAGSNHLQAVEEES